MPFSAIIGHRPLVSLLTRAVERARVPQSLLFAGPEGVGKHAVAMALAQAVNCPNRTKGDACGTCSTCLRIARGQHSDVVVLEKGDEASIKIKSVRERILDVVGYRPFEAEKRVYIIDPAEEMTFEAQDALLKTLEEPPRSVVLILISTYPDALRPTIQSRCRRLRFGWLSEDDVARVLVGACQKSAVEARVMAAASGGSVSRAMAEESGDLTDDRDTAIGLLQASAKAGGVQGRLKAATALAQVSSKRRVGEALGTRLALVASLLRDLGAIAAAGPSAPLANADLSDTLRGLTGSFSLARISDAFATVDRAQAAIDRHASPKIVADWVALTI